MSMYLVYSNYRVSKVSHTHNFRRHADGFNPPSAQSFKGISEKLRTMLDAHGEQMAKDATEGS